MTEYTHTLADHKRTVPLAIILNYSVKFNIGVVCAIASLVCFILGAVLSAPVLTLIAIAFLVPTLYIAYFWAKLYRVRTVTMLRLFKKHSVTALTYNFYYLDGVYHDVCKTISIEPTVFKKKEIQKIIYTKDTVYIKLYSTTVLTLPNQKDIREMLK